MKFDRFFNLTSYLVVFFGFLALWVSGTFGPVITMAFVVGIVLAMRMEGGRFQIPERVGTVLIFVLVPGFYIGWKFRLFGFSSNEAAIAGILARMILTLSAIKLFQRKVDRDWLFLYLMAFFEVLLAAALSISPLYLATLVGYLFVTVLAIIAFDIRKSARLIGSTSKVDAIGESVVNAPLRRLPGTAIILLVATIALAGPLFFMLPRVGGAGFGANQNGVTGLTGFSDRVRLGEIGRIQQNEQIVMRVRIDGDDAGGPVKWRGVALDTFDNKTWSKSKGPPIEPFVRNENGAFRFDYATGKREVTVQTVYLEPLDTDVLFGLWRPVAIQGNFRVVRKDGYGGIAADRSSFERVSYKIYSDRWTPSEDALRRDNSAYSETFVNYLQIPNDFDPRIAGLADVVTRDAKSRYDKARAIEHFLQNEFGYTLEQKASGDQPLADFLFNVREGHCEYFATAMVMMLRTQGIAARVVNGFQQGEYNDTAGMYVVRQRNAHSWVEVYFPRDQSWVTFDPTPFGGQAATGDDGFGIMSAIGGYIEALEAFWIQYFVSFDNQEQQSLFRSVKNGFVDSQVKMSDWLTTTQQKIQEWWKSVRGDQGIEASAWAISTALFWAAAAAAAIALLIFVLKRLRRVELFGRIAAWLRREKKRSIVEFYQRMETILARAGHRRAPHQTPLEFSNELGVPEAVALTERYNRVRFGERDLSAAESGEVENWLAVIEAFAVAKKEKAI